MLSIFAPGRRPHPKGRRLRTRLRSGVVKLALACAPEAALAGDLDVAALDVAMLGDAPVAAAPAAPAPAPAKPINYYVERRSYGTRRISEPPPYVVPLNKSWLKRYEGLKEVDWLDIGLDHRLRFESRDNDFRRSINTIDRPLLVRTRAYLALREKYDPFRFAVEISDARRFHSEFGRDTRDYNYQEPIQYYGELYFKNVGAPGKPLAIKAGRQAMEYLDRRLIARNEFRNTTNNFDGIRAIWGKQSDAWQVDALLLQPIIRDVSGFDKRDQANTLTGVIGDWRAWSRYVTLQPLYLLLMQDPDQTPTRIKRQINTYGLRAYGVLGKSGWDYDTQYLRQSGSDNGLKHEALAYVGEVGYTFNHPWKPRLSTAYNFASGDDVPNDRQSGRFERLYGFARPFSQDDYFVFENLKAPKLRAEFSPTKDLQFDTGFNWYYLDSSTDRWVNAGLRDSKGRSGVYIGHEFDARLQWRQSQYFQTEVLYAYFKSGEFARKAGRGGTSNFVFVQLSFSAF